jgi:peroxiredoxin
MKLKKGDKVPKGELFYLDENKKVNKTNTEFLFKNQKVIVFGLPGAFTAVCSAKHLPGFIKNYEEAKKKGVTKIICISVNDPFVMKAWGDLHNVKDKILMVGDPFCKFIKEIGADIDKSERGLGIRSSRFTMLLEDGVVKEIKEEKDTASCEVSAAENFLKLI